MLGRTLGIALANALLLWVAPLRGAEAAVISVGPYMPSTTMPFVVPIEISGAVDLVNWQFDLAFDPSDVQVNLACDPFSDPYCDLIFGPVTEGPFTSSGGVFQTLFVPGAVDNITGLLSIVAGAYVDLPPGPSGDGILAFVEFVTTPNGTGQSPITVENASPPGSAPEPATFALLSCGLLLLASGRRHRRGVIRARQRAACSVILNNPIKEEGK